VRRALPLLLLCACNLRAARTTVQICAANNQCDRGDVCYFGQCATPGSSNLSLVEAEVQPPNSSQLGFLQAGGIDLRQAVAHDFALQPPFAVTGVVHQDQESGLPTVVADATLTFTDHHPAIVDRVDRVTARTDANGQFSAQLPAATWDLLLQPPPPAPPMRISSPLSAAPSAPLDLHLPKPSLRTSFSGQVSAVTSAGTTIPLTGARVTAVDGSGAALSAPATTADGGFTLLLPPGTSSYSLQVGPPTDLDGGMTNADPLPNYEGLSPSPTLTLQLPDAGTLQGRVVDSTGTGVASARVYARSQAGTTWSLARSTTAASDGSYSIALREGTYLVEAAPSAASSSPGVSAESTPYVSGSTNLSLVCPAKARAFGLVTTPDGRPAGAGYQVTATRLADDLLTTRSATTLPTDSAGYYHLIGDNGRYRVEVQPPAGTRLPRKIVQIDLVAQANEYPLPGIQISPALAVVGTVHGAPPGGIDAPIAGATVDFYALDALGQHSIYIGSGLTDAQGQYTAVLPDVPQPGAIP
jgi:hypothetical protein